jgi:hypothetical protein
MVVCHLIWENRLQMQSKNLEVTLNKSSDKCPYKRTLVAYTYNPSYLGG